MRDEQPDTLAVSVFGGESQGGRFPCFWFTDWNECFKAFDMSAECGVRECGVWFVIGWKKLKQDFETF